MERRKVMGKSVKPLWERLGFQSPEKMTQGEAIYVKKVAKAIADVRWNDHKRGKKNDF